MVEENKAAQYTDIQLQFLELVKKYPVKNPETVVDYITSQEGTVLEDPEKLAVALSECEITPVRRRQILKHWFAEKGIEVAPELLRRVALPPERRKEIEEQEAAEEESKKAKYSVDEETGAIKVATTGEKALTWPEAEKLSKTIKKEMEKGEKKVAYVYDSDTNTVRMAREGEIGGTLEQAKELKKMTDEARGKGGEEPTFILDEDGNWTLNPKARVSAVDLMALESIKRAQEKGGPVDPLDALSRAAEKMKVYREALGGGNRPDWMTDPAKFIEIVERISGGGKGDETLKTELAEMRKSLDDMREQRYRDQIESQKQQIGALTNKMGELADLVADLKRPVTGRTEMDVIHEVATEGITTIRTEAAGMRGLIKEAFAGGALPQPRSAEERKDRTAKLRQAVQKDREIEEIGRRLFFGEGRETVPPQPGGETVSPLPPRNPDLPLE